MRAKVAGTVGIVAVALLTTGAACWAVAFRCESRKHELSGVPWRHYASDVGASKFYVPRSGGPVEQRLHVPMTDEQYRVWQENEESACHWGLAGCFAG